MVVKLTPKYAVFEDGPEVEPEGPLPDGAKLKLNSTLMVGPTRFTADNMLTDEQCSMLVNLADEATLGDGYNGDENPHSPGEEFFGITLLRAAKLAETNRRRFLRTDPIL